MYIEYSMSTIAMEPRHGIEIKTSRPSGDDLSNFGGRGCLVLGLSYRGRLPEIFCLLLLEVAAEREAFPFGSHSLAMGVGDLRNACTKLHLL
jgi:hypothetical protein